MTWLRRIAGKSALALAALGLLLMPRALYAVFCSPVSASITASPDDNANVYVNGVQVGPTFTYVDKSLPPPPSYWFNPAILTPTGDFFAIQNINTLASNVMVSFLITVQCADGTHSYITNQDSTFWMYDDKTGSSPPPNDGSGNPWYSPAWTNPNPGTYFNETPVAVTSPFFAHQLLNPGTGQLLTMIAPNAAGADSSNSENVYYREQVNLVEVPPPPPPSFTITKSASPMGGVPSSSTVNYTLTLCNNGGFTTDPVTIWDTMADANAYYQGPYSFPDFTQSGSQNIISFTFPNGFQGGGYCETINYTMNVGYFDSSGPCSFSNGAAVYLSGPAMAYAGVTITTNNVGCSSPTVSPTFTIAPPSHTFTPTITSTPACGPGFVSNVAAWNWGPSNGLCVFVRSSTPTPGVPPTPSDTPTATPTASPTPSRTATPTASPTPTPSMTFSPSPTYSDTVTFSFTPTQSNSFTPSQTFSATPTASPTASATGTFTGTPTFSNSPTPSSTATQSDTFTPTESFTQSDTVTPSPTPSDSFTPTPSDTVTLTPSPTSSVTSTYSDSPTPSVTPSFSPTSSITLTPTPTPTFSASPTVTPTPIPVPLGLKLMVYNSAGELVDLLFDGGAQVMPTSLSLDHSTISNAEPGGLSILFPGVLSAGGKVYTGSLPWLLTNQGGQTVEGGVYIIKAEITDQFGKVSTLQQSVQVIAAKGGSLLQIFNSAGELVYHQDLSSISASGMTDLSLPQGVQVYAPSFDASGQNSSGDLKLLARDGSGGTHTVPWDGRSDAGQPVASGVYLVELSTTNSGGSKVIVSRQLTVLNSGSGPSLSDAVAAPNPAGASSDTAYVSYTPSLGLQAVAQVYNLGGEWVLSGVDTANSGKIALPLKNLSAGVYLVTVEKREGSMVRARKIIKLAVVR